MARSKNNPDARNKMAVTQRTCDLCGLTGDIPAKVHRVLRHTNGRKRMIWKCTTNCKGV